MSATNYLTQPSYVSAEQFTAGMTAMSLVTLLETINDFTQSPTAVSAIVASLTQNGMSYTMHDTDWVVTGPNMEVVYSDALFHATFGTASGNSMTFRMGADITDSMMVDLLIYTVGATGNLDVDWGDGTTDTAITGAAPGVSTASHTYSLPAAYTILVTFTVSGTTVNQASGVYQAFVMPPSTNLIDSPASMGTTTDMPTDVGSMMVGVPVPGTPPVGDSWPGDPWTGPGQSLITLPGMPGETGRQQSSSEFTVSRGEYTAEQLAQLQSGESPVMIMDE